MSSYRNLVCMFATSLALLACSESVSDGEGGGGADASTPASSATGAGGDTTSSSASSTSATTTSGGQGGGETAGFVINEISADGDDYIELYNPTSGAIDLGGLSIADRASEGGPKLDQAITLPSGTTLAPGAYLFVLAKVDTAPSGEVMQQLDCAPGPSRCFHAPFGLSAADGDEIFVLDGDTVRMSAEFPAGAAPGGSWGRFPNGTGDFAANTPTPGAANESL